MAGTLVVTNSNIRAGGSTNGGVKHSITWTSDASGNADVALPMNGWLVKFVTDPSATAPTDDYDITLVDENGIDALTGLGANRDTANTEQVYPLVSGAATPIFLSGSHTFTVANAGNAKSGVAVFYVLNSL